MAVRMPEGKRFAVCLTFDFDAMSFFFANHDSLTPQSVSRGEYGGRAAVPRLLELLADNDIPATWFVPGLTAETWPDVVREIVDGGHEVGNHGYCHECPLDLTRDEEQEVLLRGNAALEGVTGIRPIGYRAPRWDPSWHTVELLLEHGFVYASNGMAQDYYPYRARVGDRPSKDRAFGFGAETDLLEIPSHWSLVDVVQLEHVFQPPHRIAPNPYAVERIWRDEFDFGLSTAPAGVLTYIFHPFSIARPHRFMMLRRLLAYIREHDDVWFTTCASVARNWEPDPGRQSVADITEGPR